MLINTVKPVEVQLQSRPLAYLAEGLLPQAGDLPHHPMGVVKIDQIDFFAVAGPAEQSGGGQLPLELPAVDRVNDGLFSLEDDGAFLVREQIGLLA